MLHGKNYCMNDCLEFLRVELKHSLGAVINDVVNQLKERLSEFWIIHEIVLNHCQSGLAEAEENLLEEAGKILALLFHDGRKKHQCLRIASIWIRLLIVLDHGLEGWQEIGVEIREVLLLFNVDLNQFKDVSSHSFHWSDHVIKACLSL